MTDANEDFERHRDALEGFITGRKEGLSKLPGSIGTNELENSPEQQLKVLQRWVFERIAELEERIQDLENLKGIDFSAIEIPIVPDTLNDMAIPDEDDEDDGSDGRLVPVE